MYIRQTKKRIENRFAPFKNLEFMIDLSYDKYVQETEFDHINEVFIFNLFIMHISIKERDDTW